MGAPTPPTPPALAPRAGAAWEGRQGAAAAPLSRANCPTLTQYHYVSQWLGASDVNDFFKDSIRCLHLEIPPGTYSTFMAPPPAPLEHRRRGMGGTPRGSSSTCEQRGSCPGAQLVKFTFPSRWGQPSRPPTSRRFFEPTSPPTQRGVPDPPTPPQKANTYVPPESTQRHILCPPPPPSPHTHTRVLHASLPPSAACIASASEVCVQSSIFAWHPRPQRAAVPPAAFALPATVHWIAVALLAFCAMHQCLIAAVACGLARPSPYHPPQPSPVIPQDKPLSSPQQPLVRRGLPATRWWFAARRLLRAGGFGVGF